MVTEHLPDRSTGSPSAGQVMVEAGMDPRLFLDYLALHVTPAMLQEDRLGQARLSFALDRYFYRGERRVRTGGDLYGPAATFDMESDLGRIPNSTPVVELRYADDDGRWTSSHYAHSTFRLSEPENAGHFYFFRAGEPAEDQPSYLREEDLVPSGLFSQTFPSEVWDRMKADLGMSDDGIRFLIYQQAPIIEGYQVMVERPFKNPLERVPMRGGAAERYNSVTGSWEQSGGTFAPRKTNGVGRVMQLLRPRPRNSVGPAITQS